MAAPVDEMALFSKISFSRIARFIPPAFDDVPYHTFAKTWIIAPSDAARIASGVDGREAMKRPQTTDSTGYLWVEKGEPRVGVVAEVAPILPVAHTYSFSVPTEMEKTLSLGQRVLVPLRRKGRMTPGLSSAWIDGRGTARSVRSGRSWIRRAI